MNYLPSTQIQSVSTLQSRARRSIASVYEERCSSYNHASRLYPLEVMPNSRIPVHRVPVGNYERYSLARDNTGNPQLITYVATYPTAVDLPSGDFLRTRARELIAQFPLLKGRVIDGRTTSPKWDVLSAEEVSRGLESLVCDRSLLDLVSSNPLVSIAYCSYIIPQQPSPDLEGIVSHELNDTQPLRVSSNGLLWRVSRYSSSNATGPAFLALTINHVISDGKSGLALFNALLAPNTSPETPRSGALPPTLESTVDCRPGYLYMLNVIWKELLVPKLPAFLSNPLKQTPCWPGQPASAGNLRAMYKHITLGSNQVARLKALGKANQVNTLHPILEMAAVVALWQTFGAREIAYDTPISVRDSSLGHPPMTGNYVANLESRISCSADGGERFWDKTREFSTWLSSDTGRRQAISAMGMLVHIPDGQNDVAPDSPTPTGWETFLLDKMSRAPSSSLEVSNLGYTQLPPNAQSVVFAQTPSPFIPPVVINAVGHQRGLELVVCGREGAFASDCKDVADFGRTYQAVLGYLADFRQDEAQADTSNMSFSDIKEAVDVRI